MDVRGIGGKRESTQVLTTYLNSSNHSHEVRHLLSEMAGDEALVITLKFPQQWLLHAASFYGQRAAGMKATSGWRGQRAWGITSKKDRAMCGAWVGTWRGGK